VLRGYTCLLFDLTLPAMTEKSMVTLLVFYFCQEQGKINEYNYCSDIVINLLIFSVVKNNINI
jgi:hypothetical protein